MNEHPDSIRWQEHRLARPDVALAWFDAGPRRTAGGEDASAHRPASPLVFLHGGPGMDHRHLEPAAAPLTDAFRCVLYDQRGDGASLLCRLTPAALHPDRHVEDLDALRTELGLERLTLVGHSWAPRSRCTTPRCCRSGSSAWSSSAPARSTPR
jgi:pimeloyl-ACP methyl ester carboxylesterase